MRIAMSENKQRETVSAIFKIHHLLSSIYILYHDMYEFI